MSDDDKTRLITRRSSASTNEADATVVLGQSAGQSRSRDDDGHTKLFRPSRSPAPAAAQDDGQMGASGQEDLDDPVVGWLVIVEGPGKGASLKLGFGMNSIGRAPDERVPVDFGDGEISRKSHAMLTYDPRGCKFYLQHGEGTNLTYLGDAPVLQPVELKGGELIGIGNTRFAFVPFCGPDFNW
jgi:FHA domain